MFGSQGARRRPEPTTESAREMSVVVVATRVGDFADRLGLPKKRAATQQLRGAIQPKRIQELRAGRAACCEQLLDVAQRNPRLDGHVERPEIRVREALPHDSTDARE